MRGNTLMMFVIALVFGGVAVFFANTWLKSQEARQVAQPTVAPAQVETSTIVVAARLDLWRTAQLRCAPRNSLAQERHSRWRLCQGLRTHLWWPPLGAD